MHRSIPRLTWFLPAIVAIAGLLAAPSAHAEGKRDRAKTTRAAKNRIGAVTFDGAGQQTTIRVRGTSTPTFTVYKLERPNRVVVDIAGATLDGAVKEAQENGATIPVGTWAVNQLAAYEIDDGGALVRVVVTLARPGRYDVKAVDGDVVVTVTARDAAPEASDARDVEAAEKAAAQAKKDSEAARAAKTKAEADAGKARAQADASKQEAERAKKALADAQVAAKKASQAERDRADRAVAEAKAAAERTKKASDAANEARERADRAVAEAKAEAERTREAAVEAKEQVARMQAELDAAKAEAAKRAKEAKAARAEAQRHKQEADAARADAARQKQDADDAEAEATARAEEAKRASADAAKNKQDAAAARADADAARKDAARLEAEAKAAKAEAAKARSDAQAAQKAAEKAQRQAANATADADAARADAARDKQDAAAAKRDADDAKRDAEAARRDAKAMRAEAETMLAEAKARVKEAEADARAAKQTQKQAADALAKAEAKERTAQQAADRAAAERKAAQAALEAAKKSDDDAAAKKVAEAEARLARAEKARKDAEAQKAAAEHVATTARAEADRRKAETDEAARARAAAEQDRKDAQAAAEEASARATRAERLRKDEEADAAVKAKKDQDEIDAKRAEANKLAAAAERAKKARVSEEEQLAAIVAERRAAEADVAKARAEAAAARKEAAQAVARAAAAKREAEEAERRAKAAREEAAAAKAAPAKAAPAPAPAPKVDAKPAKADAKPAKKASIAITDIGFQQHGDDARVTIALGGDVEPSVHASGSRAEMILDGVSLPKKLERKLDTSKFDGPVRAISSYRDAKDASKVHVVVELAPGATPRLEQVGSGKKTSLRWHFAAPTVAKKPASKPTKKVRTESIPAPKVGGYGASSTPVTSRSVAQAGGRRKVYRGPTIDLDFKDADIHNLLRFLANIGRVSIVVPDDIKATVTVRLKRVPWDQALEVILASKDLWYRKEGNLYRVAPRKKLDEEDEAEAERIRAAVQAEVPEAEVFTLNYASAEETAQKLQPLLSPKGKIEVDSRTNSLIISDIRAHRSRVRDLAARLDTQTPQIMIEARIVEARSTYARDLGIQWGGNANMSQAGGNATGLIFPNSISVAGGNEDRQTPLGGVASPSNFAINLPAQTGTGAGAAVGMNLGSVGGNFNLAFRLSALEDTGTVRIISQPKITVLNNSEAVISQGVSIPISVVSATGTQTQFVPADLSLTVTPYVSQRDCSIAMDVNVTKNEPDFVNTGARGDPTILRKEARTKILVADGETTVLGGITTRNTGLSYNKVPFFADLPVVGWLFKRRRENDDRTELLIFITPRITNKAFLRCE